MKGVADYHFPGKGHADRVGHTRDPEPREEKRSKLQPPAPSLGTKSHPRGGAGEGRVVEERDREEGGERK